MFKKINHKISGRCVKPEVQEVSGRLFLGADSSLELWVAQRYKEHTPGVRLLHKIPTPPAA